MRSQQRPLEETTGTLASGLQRLIPTTVKGAVSLALALGGVTALMLGGIVLLFLQELRGTAFTVLALGSILLLIGLLLSFTTVRQSIIGKRGRYGANSAVMVVAFLALAVLVYVVGARNAGRWDVTATKQFSLAPQTESILEKLPEPIQVVGFFTPNDTQQAPYRQAVESLLNEFRHRSDGELNYRFLDPDEEPTLANHYGVTQYPAVVLEGTDTGRVYRLSAPYFQERDFASALLVITGAARKQIYFLAGHGERPIGDTDANSRTGYGLAAVGMVGDSYAVDSLSFAEVPVIPTDTAAIIVAAPTLDLPEQDAQILHDYLKNGGRMLMLLEPDPPPTFKAFLARWGVDVATGTVVDLGSSLSAQAQTPLIKRDQFFANSDQTKAITLPLDEVYLPGSTAFQPVLPPDEMPDTLQLQPVARTTILSCLTLDPKINSCPTLTPNMLFPAVLVLALAPINERPVESAPREARLVLFGDADFAANFHLYSLNNSDLLLNSVNWLTEDISLASVRPKPIAYRQLVVTGRQMQLIRGMSWFVLPSVMAVLAGVAWWRRR